MGNLVFTTNFTIPQVGSITATVTTQPVITAPAQVWFDITASSGLAGGADDGSNVYQTNFHEIEWKVSLQSGLSEQWDHTENVPAENNDKYEQLGRLTCMVLPAGTHTPVLTGTDASGVVVTQVLDPIVVQDPDDVYAGAATVCLALDSNFTGKPTGALEASTLAAAITHLQNGSGVKRLLFKRSEDYADVQLNINSAATRLTHVGAWGAGNDPILRPVYKASSSSVIQYNQTHGENQVTVSDVEFVGDWDARDESGYFMLTPIDFAQSSYSDVLFTVHNVTSGGFSSAFRAAWSHATGVYSGQRAMFSNCKVGERGWYSYGLFTQDDNRDQYVAVIGCKLVQTPTALSGGGSKNMAYNLHGPARVSGCENIYMASCDLFSCNGWFENGPGSIADQACLRILSTSTPGARFNVNRCYMEGGDEIVDANGADPSQASNPGNFIFERNILVGTAQNRSGAIKWAFGGATVRNNYFYMPNVEQYALSGFEAFFNINIESNVSGNEVEPVRVYNNTVIIAQNAANDQNQDWPITETAAGSVASFTNLLVAGNVLIFADGDTPNVTHTNIDLATATPGITPRYAGRRYGFEYYSGTIPGGTLADGASMAIPYASLTTELVDNGVAGAATDQTYWQGATGDRHMIRLGNGTYYHGHEGEFTVSYDATEVTITNTSGTDWVNASYRLKLYRHNLLPARDTSRANPSTIPLPRPLAGSTALGASNVADATTRNLLGEDRGASFNAGAL